MSDRAVARVIAAPSVQIVRVAVPTKEIVEVRNVDQIPTPAEIGAYSKIEIDAVVTALKSADTVLQTQVAEGEFVFSTPSTSWVIQHNLGKRFPEVSIVDTAGDTIWTDVRPLDANTVIATFAAPTAGTAYVN